MGTRAAAFTAKIKNLNEIQMRLMQGSVPLPQVRTATRILHQIICLNNVCLHKYMVSYTTFCIIRDMKLPTP